MLCMRQCPLCNSCSVESGLQYLHSSGMASAITEAEGRSEAGVQKAMRAYASASSGRLPSGSKAAATAGEPDREPSGGEPSGGQACGDPSSDRATTG